MISLTVTYLTFLLQVNEDKDGKGVHGLENGTEFLPNTTFFWGEEADAFVWREKIRSEWHMYNDLLGYLYKSIPINYSYFLHLKLFLIPKLKLDFVSQRQNSGPDVPLKAFDLLSASQQQMISKYIRFRETGGVIEYGGYRSSPSVANKFVSLEKMKSRISSALLLIISGRCEIEEDFHHNPLCRNEIPAGSKDIFLHW